jgi:hypothetical protein
VQTLNITWAFYLAYNHLKGELFLRSSNACQTDHETPSEINLNLGQMKSIIHKYDFRKFQYFSERLFKEPFDTMLRLKCENTQEYIRTQAICESTSNGFHCVLIEDRRYHELSKKLASSKITEANFNWLDETLTHYESLKHLKTIKQHLTQMIMRQTN